MNECDKKIFLCTKSANRLKILYFMVLVTKRYIIYKVKIDFGLRPSSACSIENRINAYERFWNDVQLMNDVQLVQWRIELMHMNKVFS